MDLKTQKRTKMHHVITLTFCYFPFAWLVNLWVMRSVRMDCKDINKLIVPLIVETVAFMIITHFFNDMERLEQLLRAICKTCPKVLVPLHTNVKDLRKTLYVVRVLIFASLIATLPWGGNVMGIMTLILWSGFIWLEAILQDMYYIIIYYEMFGKYKNKDSG